MPTLDRGQTQTSWLDFRSQAERNVTKWGLQDIETLALAIAEETGELAQAVLQHKHESGSILRVYEEAKDLGALCIQIRQAATQVLHEEVQERKTNAK